MKEKYYSDNISCGHCYNISKMELLGNVQDITETWGDDEGPSVDFYDVYELLKCPRCKRVNIRMYKWGDFLDGGEEHYIEYRYLYPSDNQIPSGLPENINKAYKAAEMIKNIDANAYATLLRRLLEMVCFDRKA